jgi:hypothetical protein
MLCKAAVVILALVLAVSAVCLLGGCSGAGESAAVVRGDATQALAAGQVTAASILKQWLSFLYADEGLSFTSAAPAAVARVRSAAKPRTVHPADNTTYPGYVLAIDDTSPEGVHFVYYLWFTDPDTFDGSGYGDITWPDGRSKHVTFSAYYDAPPPYTGHKEADFTEQWSNGISVAYHQVELFSAAEDSHQKWWGTATMPGGLTAQFTIDRNIYRDIITFADGNGSTVTFTVPLTQKLNAPYWPQFSQPLSGACTVSGTQQTFTMTGGPDEAWHAVAFTSTGASAQFTLGSGLTGSGEIRQGGNVAGALTWDASADGTLTQVNAQASAVLPIAAAQRFAVDQWMYSVSALGPAPEWGW